MDNKDLPAYPHIGYETSDNGMPGYYTTKPGLSKRETIAAMCLQGLLSNQRLATGSHLSVLATECADALLTHLQNNP